MNKLSIIIPTYNEEKTILNILKRIHKTKHEYIAYEIIVVDDGSTDNTQNLLKDNSSLYSHLIIADVNGGKGAAIKLGLKKVSGDYIIFQDADLEYDPIEFKKFIKIIEKFKPDCVLGSRMNYDSYTRSHNLLNKIANFFITNFFNVLFNTTFTDIYCCYMCFKSNLINVDNLKTNGFEQHAEILCKIIKKGNSFFEVPINYNGRNLDEGKKIRFYHFFPVIFRIFIEKIIR